MKPLKHEIERFNEHASRFVLGCCSFLVAMMLGNLAAADALAADGESPRKLEVIVCDAEEDWKSFSFGPWVESHYVLPYTVGESYVVNQSNCSGLGHSDFWAFGYDFIMPIGTIIRAARPGVVSHAQDGAVDGDRERTNFITITHDDGSVAVYSHFTLNGVLVKKGQNVDAGEIIGRSGLTGNTGGLPHLHFSVHPCGELPGVRPGHCPSIPVNFRNTRANVTGLVSKESYEALPYYRCPKCRTAR